MTNKKRIIEGVNGTGCNHNRCSVLDTHTKYGEVVLCLDCNQVFTKSGWDRLHKKNEGINWIDKISDEGYAFIWYFAIYLILMVAYWGLSL